MNANKNSQNNTPTAKQLSRAAAGAGIKRSLLRNGSVSATAVSAAEIAAFPEQPLHLAIAAGSVAVLGAGVALKEGARSWKLRRQAAAARLSEEKQSVTQNRLEALRREVRGEPEPPVKRAGLFRRLFFKPPETTDSATPAVLRTLSQDNVRPVSNAPASVQSRLAQERAALGLDKDIARLNAPQPEIQIPGQPTAQEQSQPTPLPPQQ